MSRNRRLKKTNELNLYKDVPRPVSTFPLRMQIGRTVTVSYLFNFGLGTTPY